MVYADDRLLEFLSENGPHSPKEIKEDDRFCWTRKHINDRCKKLHEYGLLQVFGRGVYSITDKGEAYLREELDASELEASELESDE